jgi:hypothetical protein
MKVWDFPKCRDANVIADAIEKFCAETRRILGEHGYALSKHVAGQVPDNVAADQVNQRGVRLRHTEHEKVFVEEPLSENFTLAIKHPLAFTALLATLRERFDCYAIIRYPLSTMASLNSLAWLNVGKGHAPIGEKLDLEFQRALAAEPDTIERQLLIMDWFYKRFREFLPETAIVKYEELISSQGRVLERFFPGAGQLEESLSSKNVNKFYDRALMLDQDERLLRREGPMWDYCKRSDVEQLMAEVSASTSVPSDS